MNNYERWFKSLRSGDPVRVRKPWDDAKTPGGRIVKGHVRRVNDTTVTVYYRNRFGRRLYDVLSNHSTPYTQLQPADGRVVYYDPKRGYVLSNKRG